jgi:hypothetical protein
MFSIRSERAPQADKTIVLSLMDDETGEVRSEVVPDVTGHTLRKVIADQVAMSSSDLVTDEGSWYCQLGTEFLSHEAVNHSADEYVRYTSGRAITTNRVEGYFSQLKRSIDGTHHNRVERRHVHRYLGEFDMRYTTRKMKDADRFALLGRRLEGRLTYRALTAR